MEKFENINELIVALLFWITSHTDYKNPIEYPVIEFIEQKVHIGRRHISSDSSPTEAQNQFIII